MQAKLSENFRNLKIVHPNSAEAIQRMDILIKAIKTNIVRTKEEVYAVLDTMTCKKSEDAMMGQEIKDKIEEMFNVSVKAEIFQINP